MKSVVDANRVLISNSFVKCYSDYFIINLYYFPFGNKKIRYDQIRSCDFLPMSEISFFNIKLWGMTLSPIWWHCDMSRYRRQHYILLDANQWPKIGLTMDDKDILNVYNLIKQKMNSNIQIENIKIK